MPRITNKIIMYPVPNHWSVQWPIRYPARIDAGSVVAIAVYFNANSPIQHIDPAKCKPRTQREWSENGGGLNHLGVIAALPNFEVGAIGEREEHADQNFIGGERGHIN